MLAGSIRGRFGGILRLDRGVLVRELIGLKGLALRTDTRLPLELVQLHDGLDRRCLQTDYLLHCLGVEGVRRVCVVEGEHLRLVGVVSLEPLRPLLLHARERGPPLRLVRFHRLRVHLVVEALPYRFVVELEVRQPVQVFHIDQEGDLGIDRGLRDGLALVRLHKNGNGWGRQLGSCALLVLHQLERTR